VSFDANVANLREWYAAVNDGDLDAVRTVMERFADPDIEIVTRDGVVHGTDYFLNWLESQWKNFDLLMEPQEFVDAGGGCVLAFLSVRRVGKDPSVGDLNAWPANAFWFDGDRAVKFEGWQNRQKARRALGLETR
jgi:hypothetical protein